MQINDLLLIKALQSPAGPACPAKEAEGLGLTKGVGLLLNSQFLRGGTAIEPGICRKEYT